jgi:branched-chain amino acid transport system ATP-binding protein
VSTAILGGVPVLETRGLSKAFGGVHAVRDVDLAMPKGEIRALIGPNGAGKTTFFNMLTGQLRADAGLVLFKGERLGGLPPYAVWRRGVSRTFQITATFATLTALENVQVARLSHLGKTYALLERAQSLQTAEAHALLEQVGLANQAGRVAAVLAYGDLKKLELAVALANDPELLLLDEPTASLDERIGTGVWELLQELSKSMTVVVISHDIGAISRHVRTVACLNRRLHAHPSRELTAEMLEATYGCPIDLIAHGHPHRVLGEHGGGGR